MAITTAFETGAVEVLASPQSISRGRTYAEQGKAAITALSDTEIKAEVRGTMRYRVRLWLEGTSTRWHCDCPVGSKGEFCKHCVAALIAATDPSAGSSTTSAAAQPGAKARDEIARHARSLSNEQLVELVVEHAELDDRFRTRFLRIARLQNAAPASPSGSATDGSGEELDLRALKKEVTAAFGRGFVDYRRAPGWAAGVFEAIEWIADIGEAGHFRTAALLAQHAHARAESAIGRVDDSDGWITDISTRVGAIHATVCHEGAFPPEDLARRLIKLELGAELDTFHRGAVTHRDALGPEGLAVYGELAQKAFDALPADSDRYGKAFRVRQARIAHALATDDPDLLVEVMADDIGSPADHVEIIDAFDAAGRPDEALAWADTSLSLFADRHRQLVPVRERRADLLRRTGDTQAAVDMYRDSFETSPTPETYRLFIEAADDSEAAHLHAVEYVTSLLPEIDPDVAEPRIGRQAEAAAAAAVITVLLAAEEDEQAWSLALVHGAGNHDWRQMAERRQIEDPESAIAVLALETERAIDQKNRSGYRTAVKLLSRIERLANAADDPKLHQDLLADITSCHHRKTSLMQLLGER